MAIMRALYHSLTKLVILLEKVKGALGARIARVKA